MCVCVGGCIDVWMEKCCSELWMLLVGWWVNGCVFVAASMKYRREGEEAKLNVDLCVCVCVITAFLNGPISAGPVGGRGACGWNFSCVSKELFNRAQKCGCV